MPKISLSKRLTTLIDQFTPEIRDAFFEAIRDVKDRVILNELVRAIELGDPVRAFRTLGFNDAAMRPLTAMIERAFETGGITTVTTFPRIRDPLTAASAVFRFDVRNSRAEAWLRDHSSTLVTRITNDQMEAIRNVVTEGMQAGRNPRNVALDIVGRIDPASGRRTGGIVGLTLGQERAVARARQELSSVNLMSSWFDRKRRDRRFDGLVRQAIDSGEGLSPENINRLIGRYSDSLLQLRGETIGRTEALRALNKSADEAFRQVIDTGAVRPNNVKRIWDSAGDNRVRDSHKTMDGQTVGIDEAFKTPGGFQMMFPGDTSIDAPAEETINCRCVVRVDVDWLAGAAEGAPEPPAPPPMPKPILPPVPAPPPPLGLPLADFLSKKGLGPDLPSGVKYDQAAEKFFDIESGDPLDVIDILGMQTAIKIEAEKAALVAEQAAKLAELAALKEELAKLKHDPNADDFTGSITSDEIIRTHGQLPDYVPETYDNSLYDYVGMGYAEINRYLRDRATNPNELPRPHIDRQVAAINALMKPSKMEYVVYRGVREDQLKSVLNGKTVGDEFTMDGLTSVSRASKVSMRFATGGLAEGQSGGILFKFELPEGTRMITTNKWEAEMILESGHKFLILDIEDISDEFRGSGTPVKYLYTIKMVS